MTDKDEGVKGVSTGDDRDELEEDADKPNSGECGSRDPADEPG